MMCQPTEYYYNTNNPEDGNADEPTEKPPVLTRGEIGEVRRKWLHTSQSIDHWYDSWDELLMQATAGKAAPWCDQKIQQARVEVAREIKEELEERCPHLLRHYRHKPKRDCPECMQSFWSKYEEGK